MLFQNRPHSKFVLPLILFMVFVPNLVQAQKGIGIDHQTQHPSWLEELKGQTILENTLEGHPNRAALVEKQHARAMANTQTSPSPELSGLYHSVTMNHQYGAGPQDYLLASDAAKEPVSQQGAQCPKSAPIKHYDISAINVEITLNQWLDYYPGYMYTLTENLNEVRDEEFRNAEARAGERFSPGAVTNGLQNQWIQPLVLRANQGDCVKVILRNQLEFGESVSLHIQGSDMIISKTRLPALSTNPDSIAKEKTSIEMEWHIHSDTQEGVHQFHSYSNDRELTVMGLFGAFVVEPKGSIYLDPLGTGTPTPIRSGWQAMIDNGQGPDFREFVIIYHEVGDGAFRGVNRDGDFLPSRDPLTDAYHTGLRGLNYRSEPFGYNNMWLQREYFGFEDESMGYSSYTFGDPATTIPRSYLGDPAKFRLVHGGSEIFHSHHPHGGSIRWPRNPRAQDHQPLWHLAKDGPVKYPPLRTTTSRVDAEMIGPSEAIDLETECGSGLCQQVPGDFLFHCHVAQHYVAGMWGFWRVYNTLQGSEHKNDLMPVLRELPDRQGIIKPGVTSDQLVGTTVDWMGKRFSLLKNSKSNWIAHPALVSITDWVNMQLPTQGQPGHQEDEQGQTLAYDATVLDWSWDNYIAMSEKESTIPNPKYRSPTPNQRRPLLFEPLTGKIAWPHLTPHFGKRPPFAPNHNPAPWLEMIHLDENGQQTSEPAQPGENGPWSLCPKGAGEKSFNVHFINLPITMAKQQGEQPPIIDKNGLLFVLHEEEELVRGNDELKYPLVFRANVYDCIDYMLTSEWEDDDFTNFHSSKVNIHPHLLQFDTQGSDGVISGFSYEQSVRPFTMKKKQREKGLPAPMNTSLIEPAKKGSQTIHVFNARQFHVNTEILIGADNVSGQEVQRITAIEGHTITLTNPLKHDHPKEDIVTVEFVRYRLWADADVGTVFWHDHAFGIMTWPHGGFGTLVVEPRGSTYHDPTSGKEIRSGPLADIHTTEPVGDGVQASFRELVLQLQDTVPHTVNIVTKGNPPGQPIETALDAGRTVSFIMPQNENIKKTPMSFLDGGTHTTGSGFNFRVEPLAQRLANHPDPSILFSSLQHGDPDTPLLRAYLGDPIVFRLVETGMNETLGWTLAGHTFLTERYAPLTNRKNSIHIGISEKFDLIVPQAGGPRHQPGDYIHFNGRPSKFSEGSWGLIRVLEKKRPDLQKLPSGSAQSSPIPTPMNVCPITAPVKSFDVAAIDFPEMVFNTRANKGVEVDFERIIQTRNPDAKIYVLEKSLSPTSMEHDQPQPMPLVLRANIGDCLKIHLTNKLTEGRASFSALALAFAATDSQGINVGRNPGDQTIGPGETRTYTYFADPSLGEISSLVLDWGDITSNPRNGLFGAIIIGPKGSHYRHPETGENLDLENNWISDVLVDRTIPENKDRQNYRDAALFFQEEDNVIGTAFMPYIQNTAGLIGVNYRSEPYWVREEEGCSLDEMFQPCPNTDLKYPTTPLIRAHAGDPVRLHVFGATIEQNAIFSIEGHEWPSEPFLPGADDISAAEFSGAETVDVFLNSAGGRYQQPGDYVWQNARLPYSQAGQWGYFRVLPQTASQLIPLSQSSLTRNTANTSQVIKDTKILP